MPSGDPVIPHDQPLPDNSQSQIKVCAACHSPLSSESVYLLHEAADASDTSIVCGPCRTRFLTLRTELPLPANHGLFAEVERELLRRAALVGGDHEAGAQPQHAPATATAPAEPCIDEDMEVDASAVAPVFEPRVSYARTPSLSDNHQTTHTTASLVNNNDVTSFQTGSGSRRPQGTVAPSAMASSSKQSQQHDRSSVSLDPLVDITRLRVRPQGHHCLYPGASFQGTQKSGRNSYDVNVTIVDVDFSASHLCGYLRIRGLTDDWPELTTYFDAEIIGSRYGFLTRNWGATEQEDMVHWARFPAFRHVRNELQKPHLTMSDMNRGAVFMRWKEKFLVPDHRVQDISGASFAGFYYVCVDFNPQQSATTPLSQQASLPTPSEMDTETPPPSSLPSQAKPEPSLRARRTSVNHGARKVGRSSSRGVTPNVATMSGFYFHQNSEPYQQLSLVHVPERTTSCFEFR